MMPPEFATRLGLALLLGSLIGIERQWQQRLAGLRTNALVAIGSALFAMLTPLSRDESSPTGSSRRSSQASGSSPAP